MPERSTVETLEVRSGELRLQGVLHRPPAAQPVPGVVVCHPHPLYGGDMENHVVVAICQALAESGIAALRFNFRGTPARGRPGGSSEGTHDAGRGERDDAIAAINTLREQPGIDRDRLGLAGYSFGAGVAARAAADAGVRALALVALPVRGGTSANASLAFSGPLLLITGEHDPIAPPAELRRLMMGLPNEQKELVIVPGTDHFWFQGLTELTARLVIFFRKWLTREP